MRSTFKAMALVLGCLLVVGSASAQWTLFTVEEGAVPNGTTYPTLAQAIATAETYPGGPHKIMIKAGDYYGVDFAPNGTKIGEIYGDPAAAVGDIVFHGGSDFMTVASGMTISHLTITGYDDAFNDDGGAVTGVTIDDVVCDGNVNGVWFAMASTGNDFTNSHFANNTGYGVVLGSLTSGNNVEDNCFVDNGDQGYDGTNPAANNWDHNFYSDDVAGVATYTGFAGAGFAVDADPWRHENLASGPATGELGSVITVYFNWTIPECADGTDLAAYDFTARFNAAKLEYVSGSFWPSNNGFLGPDDTQGGDAVYAFDASDAGIGQLHFAGANFTTPATGEGVLASAQFLVIDALTSVSVYTTSDYRDGNNDPIPVPGAPTYFNIVLEDNTAPVMDPIDVLASNYPADKYSKNGSGPGPFVALFFDGMHATDNFGLDKIQWSIDDANWNDWFFTGATDDYTDPAPREFDIEYVGTGYQSPFEGAAVAYVRCVDAAGNPSASVAYNFVIDRSCATAALALADKGCAFFDGYTADETVAYAITGADADVVNMQHRDVGFTGWTTEAFVAAGDYLLNVTEVVHTVQYYLWDDVGNRSGAFSDAMRLDKTPPVPVGPLVINGGAAKTMDENVTVTLSNWGGSDMVILTETGANDPCVPGDWTNRYGITWPMPYVLDPVTDGLHTVEFFGADSAGNVSVAALTDDITLDTEAPTVNTVTVFDDVVDGVSGIAGGEDCTDTYLCKVTIDFDDSDNDAVWVHIDHGGAFTSYGDGSTIITSPVTYVYDMNNPGVGPTPTSGVDVTVNVEVYDNTPGYNVGTGSDNIWLDAANPPMTGVVLSDLNAPAGGNAVHTLYTNEAEVAVEFTGLTDDVVEIGVSEDGGSTWAYFDVSGDMPADPYDWTYTYAGTPTECANTTLDFVALDCSGNPSAVFSPYIRFDFTDPEITAFTGPTTTASLAVTLAITATDNCTAPYQMMITEVGSALTPTWVAFNAAPVFNLDPAGADGIRTLQLVVGDRAGNVVSATPIDIEVDLTAPLAAGDVWVVSDNPLAMIDYTDSRSAGYNAFHFTPDPADGVTEIFIYNNDYSWSTGWVPAVSPIDLGLLTPTGVGDKTIRYYYRDAVFNQSVEFTHAVHFDPNPAPIPTNVCGVAGCSVELTWDDMDVQKYHIRYNYAGGYPQYADVVTLGPPPFPASFMQGIPAASDPVDPEFHFVGPQPDLYAFSIWSLSKAGVWSIGPNSTVLANNYVKGDVSDNAGTYGPDGCIDFDPEFVFLAGSYLTSTGDAAFDEYMDFAPTVDGTVEGYSLPDGVVDFEDLVIFALNYRDFRCSKKSSDGDREFNRGRSVASDLTITAEVPSFARINDRFTVPISISDGAGVAGYHMVFDYDHSTLELVSVQPGDVYAQQNRTFFYHDVTADGIDISSVVLADDLAGGEIAVLTFRSRVTGPVTLEEELLDVRDWSNRRAEVDFSLAAKGGTLPTDFSLSQNYPNPFNPTTTIELALPQASEYRLTVYNIIGQVVDVFEGYADAGYVTFNWDASEQSSGVYLYKVTAGSFTATRKMVLLK